MQGDNVAVLYSWRSNSRMRWRALGRAASDNDSMMAAAEEFNNHIHTIRLNELQIGEMRTRRCTKEQVRLD